MEIHEWIDEKVDEDIYGDAWGEEEELTIAEAKRLKHNAYMKSYNKTKNAEFSWLKNNARVLAQELANKGLLKKLDSGTMKFLSDVSARWPCKFPPVLVKLFKGDVQVGRSVTARECMERIYKGRSEMRDICKRWALHGYRLRYDIDPEGGPLEARYIIEELPVLVPSELKIIRD